MPIQLAKTNQLFDRLWRPGHPFRPRCSCWRRYGILGLFLLFTGVIGTYVYLTDSARVRELSENYLSQLLHTRVTVGRATLSIFEGLQLGNVLVRVDGIQSADSEIFAAENIELQYDLKEMLVGKIVARRLIATSPHVRLVENLQTHSWNYQRLLQRSVTSGPSRPNKSPVETVSERPAFKWPEVVLRNARIEYAELSEEMLTPVGSITLEGRFWPNLFNGRCNFEMQSRGAIEGVGPVVTGSFDPQTGGIAAQLRNFRFGRDLTTMLPAQVRSWWIAHDLDGRLNVPDLSYSPLGANGKPAFRVEMQLDGVKLAIRPEELIARSEFARLRRTRDALATMRIAGLAVAGLNELSDLTRMDPIRLERAAGTFIFTQDGIEIRDVVGRLEDNGLRVSGHIDGYSPDSPAVIQITSLSTENLRLPHAPRYANSLPAQVREVYDMLKPEGVCSLALQIRRDEAGQRPEVTGEIHAIDVSFSYRMFPYPIRAATGTLILGRDPVGGLERVDIHNLRGRGLVGGPNESAHVTINGWLGPFDERIGCDVKISGENAHSEKLLWDAFKPEVRRAIALFDPDGKGEYPKLTGRLACRILSSIGLRPDTTVTSEILLDDASGTFAPFPYPLEHVKGRLYVTGDYVDVDLKMDRGESRLSLNGNVGWKKDIEAAPPIPNLRVMTRNLPLDAALLRALSPEQRKWIDAAGLQGQVDLDGRIMASSRRGEMGYDLDGTVHDATVWPFDGKPTITGLSGAFHFTPEELVLKAFTASRGTAELRADGTVRWQGERPVLALTAIARNLSLDESVFHLLPENARRWWTAIKPEGSIDADFEFSGVPSASVASTTGPASPTTAPLSVYQLSLRPRALSIKPVKFPYQLTGLSGAIEFSPGRVEFKKLSARHETSNWQINGGTDAAGDGTWELSLIASDVNIDPSLMSALPEGIHSTMTSLSPAGHISLNCPKMIYHPAGKSGSAGLDLEAKISTADASLQSAIPITDIDGAMSVAMLIREGRVHAAIGKLKIESMRVSDRPVTKFQADLSRPVGESDLQIGKIQAELAGGEVAGQINLAFPEQAPAGYGVNLVIRGVDVQELARMETKNKIEGRISASLTLEGAWADPTTRRGRGDVLVTGKQLYQIPVVVGLLEVTNLSLPISSPFEEGTSRYSVDGQRVIFEAVQLKSKSMAMNGSGWMDFASKKLELNLSTDSPNWPKLPFVSELVQNAKQELLQIRVRGTIQSPKVSAAPMNTFTTTIDEVLRGADTHK